MPEEPPRPEPLLGRPQPPVRPAAVYGSLAGNPPAQQARPGPQGHGPGGATAATPPGPAIQPPAEPGEAPAAINVPGAPGHDGAMGVVTAAEVLRRVNRTRQAVSLVSQVIIRSYEEEALHAEVCRHLVTFGGYLMAWVGIAEEKPDCTVRAVAHAGLEPNFLRALKITWANDLATSSPTSRALQEQRPYVARNILQEPRYAVLREEAQLFGYTATCALPLQFAQYGLGVLTIHAMEPDAFGAEEVSLLRELSNDLAAGVIMLRERGKRQVLEERLAAVMDAADDAIVGLDAEGRVTDWNAGATRLFGHLRSQAVGRPVLDLLVPPDRRGEAEAVLARVARGERVPRFETVRRRSDGRLVHTSVTTSPIFAGDDVVGSTSVEHDVTAIRAAQAAQRTIDLEEAEVMRLKGLERVRKTFISEASHELNTPLTPLRLHVEALAERDDLLPEHREHLAVIERNVLRLGNLVHDMLEASRLETGRFRLELDDVPLALLVDEAVQGLAEPAGAAGVAIRHAPAARVAVEADRNRLGQVLYNLLNNAIAFSPPGGLVKVSTRVEGGEAVVRIADAGVGLTPEQVDQLFLPFSRPHERSGHGAKGTGLGLFISKGIVEQHGGRIWAESKGPGLGSSFCFALPLAQPRAAAGGAAGGPGGEAGRAARR